MYISKTRRKTLLCVTASKRKSTQVACLSCLCCDWTGHYTFLPLDRCFKAAVSVLQVICHRPQVPSLPVLFLSEFAIAWVWTSCPEIALRRGSLDALSASLALACLSHISGGWTCARKVALLLQIAMGGGSLDNANLRSEMGQVVCCLIINPVCNFCKFKV